MFGCVLCKYLSMNKCMDVCTFVNCPAEPRVKDRG